MDFSTWTIKADKRKLKQGGFRFYEAETTKTNKIDTDWRNLPV